MQKEIEKESFLRRITETVKYFLITRRLGFYFIVAAVVLALVQVIIYGIAFSELSFTKYRHWSVIFFSVISIISGLGLTVSRWTSPWAAGVMLVMEFLSFLMFFKYGYMYFSELFFAGVTAEVIGEMYYGYMASMILYVLVFIIGIAAVFLKQYDNRITTDKKGENDEKKS